MNPSLDSLVKMQNGIKNVKIVKNCQIIVKNVTVKVILDM